VATVQELLPGDLVTHGLQSATFIASGRHPKYTGLALVIWKLNDGTWSTDALYWHQYVGEVTFSTHEQRWNRIQEAFRDSQHRTT
jgi:hypothetical protein